MIDKSTAPWRGFQAYINQQVADQFGTLGVQGTGRADEITPAEMRHPIFVDV